MFYIFFELLYWSTNGENVVELQCPFNPGTQCKSTDRTHQWGGDSRLPVIKLNSPITTWLTIVSEGDSFSLLPPRLGPNKVLIGDPLLLSYRVMSNTLFCLVPYPSSPRTGVAIRTMYLLWSVHLQQSLLFAEKSLKSSTIYSGPTSLPLRDVYV